MHNISSTNVSGICEDGAIVCYMNSPSCRNAAGCEDVCRPLGHKDIYVEPQCMNNQCRCVVSDECTSSDCKERCGKEFGEKNVKSWECGENNDCICTHYKRGTGTAIRPSVLTTAIILLTTLAMIPAPPEGKLLGALLIPSAILGFSISQLAFG
ncbi:uncharacterized protein LOC144149028 [Haemaphysalis longicornis]